FSTRLDDLGHSAQSTKHKAQSSKAQSIYLVLGAVELMAFQISGKVPQLCPRCCGRKANKITRPLPSGTSARAICPRRRSSPSNQPERKTFSLAYLAITRAFGSVGGNEELLMKYPGRLVGSVALIGLLGSRSNDTMEPGQ